MHHCRVPAQGLEANVEATAARFSTGAVISIQNTGTSMQRRNFIKRLALSAALATVGLAAATQAQAALWAEIGDELLERFRGAAEVAGRLANAEREVVAGKRSPAAAARDLLAAFLGER